MREFKLLNLSVFYEEDNELKLVKESIIARGTFFGNYKEIVTGIKFKPRCLNEEVFFKYYKYNSFSFTRPVDVFDEKDKPLWAKMSPKSENKLLLAEKLAHNYFGRLIKKYGFVFVLNYKNNDFNNLRIANLGDASSYKKTLYSTKFYDLIDTYNHDSKRYYKQDKAKIKERIRSEL